ncbi:hypothetical protein C6Y14_00570 [Streptomyces dioscori]|uniref:Mycothiol-dependent maleylpyruvate isomerase metal-binding domain-containing protein n=1 Tax=Streptomyces dioscori TaxID=2109333 RepID=A0A2P8QEI6_9ACTN|nr:hypothetical protein [Streptomyces dioscori]PSM44675.1 hypothetical protein C6Y14_00570 [Streptomyces dioscori]
MSLLDLLRGLRRSEWNRAAVPGRTVRDLAVHILGDCHGRLGRPGRPGRSAASPQPAMAPGEPLELFIHRADGEWIDLHTDRGPAEIIDALSTVLDISPRAAPPR